jgi:hypothetical protein
MRFLTKKDEIKKLGVTKTERKRNPNNCHFDVRRNPITVIPQHQTSPVKLLSKS